MLDCRVLEIEIEIRAEIRAEMRAEMRAEIRAEMRADIRAEIRAEIVAKVLDRQQPFMESRASRAQALATRPAEHLARIYMCTFGAQGCLWPKGLSVSVLCLYVSCIMPVSLTAWNSTEYKVLLDKRVSACLQLSVYCLSTVCLLSVYCSPGTRQTARGLPAAAAPPAWAAAAR